MIRRCHTATLPRVVAVAALALLLPYGALRAQNSDPVAQANALMKDADQLALHGDTAAALERLERATQLAPGLAEAHYRRAVLLVRQSGTGAGSLLTRHTAEREILKALKIDQSNPRYLLELGRLRLKQGFRRLEAQWILNRALDAAKKRGNPKLLAEIQGEIGDIYYRRYLAVGHRRQITGDAIHFDPDEAIGNPHYARDFLDDQTTAIDNAGELDLRRAELHYRAGLAADPGNDASAAGLLGILYDGKRYEEYLDAARAFVRAAPKSARAHLFLGLGMWRAGRAAEASRAFQRALALMDPTERAHISDLSVILRREDAHRYENLTAAQRAEYNRVYWAANDPLKLTGENEHLLEHLSRVAYTELRFAAPDLHLRGWDSDRGVIYIRYGPPPVIATFAPGTQAIGTNDPTNVGKITTVWFYPERNLRFVFYGPPGYNFARFAGEFKAYAEDARYAVPVRYDNVPVDEALDSVAMQTAEFRPPADSATGKTELVVYAGVPVKRMAKGVDLARGPLETGLFLSDMLERPIIQDRQHETVQFGASRQFERRTFTADVPPGQYDLRVEALQPTTRRAARGRDRITLESLDRKSLEMSDVVLADRVAPRRDAPTGRKDFFLDPNPAMVYAPGDQVHLYWEMYNLTPDSTGTVRYRTQVVIRVQSLERHGFAARVVGGVLDAVGASAKGDDEVSLSYQAATALAGRDRVPGWVALSLADAPKGAYTLEIAITDLVSGQTAVRQRSFTVTDEEAP